MSGEVKLNTEPADGAARFKSCGKKFSPSMTSDKSEVVHGKLLYGTIINREASAIFAYFL